MRQHLNRKSITESRSNLENNGKKTEKIIVKMCTSAEHLIFEHVVNLK